MRTYARTHQQPAAENNATNGTQPREIVTKSTLWNAKENENESIQFPFAVGAVRADSEWNRWKNHQKLLYVKWMGKLLRITSSHYVANDA